MKIQSFQDGQFESAQVVEFANGLAAQENISSNDVIIFGVKGVREQVFNIELKEGRVIVNGKDLRKMVDKE